MWPVKISLPHKDMKNLCSCEEEYIAWPADASALRQAQDRLRVRSPALRINFAEWAQDKSVKADSEKRAGLFL